MPTTKVEERVARVLGHLAPHAVRSVYPTPPNAELIGMRRAQYSDEEWKVRCDLAAGYHIAHHKGWTQDIFNHITAVVPGTREIPGGPHFLINPFGLKFNEVYASSLLKVDLSGNIVDPGDGSGPLFKQGFVVHSAVHQARHDINVVVHNHHTDVAAVGMTAEGVLPLTQEAMGIFGRIAYHPFEGTATSLEERARMAASLGPAMKVMILENHGPLTGGATFGEAFFLMATLTRACEYQTRALAIVGGDLSRLKIPSKEALEEAARRAGEMAASSKDDPSSDYVGKFWDAMVRDVERLDGASNIYRCKEC
jgi:adducin